MVWHPPAFFAIRQHSRFSSSELVTAIIRSAFSIPASICTEYPAPFPTMPIMSKLLLTFCTTSLFVSIIVILCPSLLNFSASVAPTLPHPTIIICIFSSLRPPGCPAVLPCPSAKQLTCTAANIFPGNPSPSPTASASYIFPARLSSSAMCRTLAAPSYCRYFS